MQPAVFTTGLVLLLNIWSTKRTGLPPEMNSAIMEVHKCMATMQVCEKRCARRLIYVSRAKTSSPRWQAAGLFWYVARGISLCGIGGY